MDRHAWNDRYAAADLEPTGLTVTKAERVHRTVTTPDGDHTAIDALVTARR